MKRAVPRNKIIGFGAWIKRTAESKWERVGCLFGHRGAASAYANTEFPEAFAKKTQAIRSIITPRISGSSWADHKAS